MTDGDTALLLARIQFAFTISFHFIFPAFSIGLASYLAVLEGLWLKTGREVYLTLFRYWLKIFAMAFAMGVVSGIVMTYQFGTNWSVFSDRAGPVIGPLMAYEVLTAFFLEAGFLGVMLFGLERVGKKLHFVATLMVAAGTAISAFWILSVNSWMHTPVGWALNDKGQFIPAAPWIEIIFNPSFPYRLVHTVIAAYLTTALVVGGVGAWHMLRERRGAGESGGASAAPSDGTGSAGPLAAAASPDFARQNQAARTAPSDGTGVAGPLPAAASPHFAAQTEAARTGPLPAAASPHPAPQAEAARIPQNQAARTMFSMAMWMAALVAPVQIVVGDLHGLNTLEHQPAKVMAMEGHYESHPEGAPLALFGIPNDEEERLDYAIEIPKLSSLILKHDPDAPLAGLKTIPKADRPPAEIVFWSFRVMVGLGMLMLALGLWSLVARFRKRLYDWTSLHRFALLMSPAGFVAVIAGWITTEVGRQPWVIYGLMRTAEARAPIDAPAVGASLLTFVIVYFVVFGAGTLYVLRLMARPPHDGEAEPAHSPIRTAGITPSGALRRGGAAGHANDGSGEAGR